MRTGWRIAGIFLFGLGLTTSFAPVDPWKDAAPFDPGSQKWADSVLQTLSDKEKIAQLLVVPSDVAVDSATSLISARYLKKFPIGGVVYGDRHIEQAKTDATPKVPLLNIARMESLFSGQSNEYPSPAALAAVTDERLLLEMGQIMAEDLRERNFQMSILHTFPSEDNTPPGSYELYSRKATQVIKGIQSGNIVVCLVEKDNSGLLEGNLTESGSMAFTPTSGNLQDSLPSSVSGAFGGLKVLDLKAISTTGLPQEEIIIKAFSHDYDLAVGVLDAEAALEALTLALKKGLLDEQSIENKVRKVLTAKAWSFNGNAVPARAGTFAIDNLEQVYLKKVREKALTLVKNDNKLIPFRQIDTLEMASVYIGHHFDEEFQSTLDLYKEMPHYQIFYKSLEEGFVEMKKGIDGHGLIILYVADLGEETRDLDMGHLRSVVERIAYQGKVVMVWGGKAEDAVPFLHNPNIPAVLFTYSDHPESRRLSAQALFGGTSILGRLPMALDSAHTSGSGFFTAKSRLGYGYPEEVGIDRMDLDQVDNIVKEGLDAKAYPGAQVFFAKDGLVVFNKAYGHHTYEEKNQVQLNDLYDLASITKIASTTGALMKLATEGKFSLDANLCDYLSEELDSTCYAEMEIRAMLAHQAGLPPYVPFFSKTLVKGVPRYDVYSLAPSDMYPFRVAENLYIRKDYRQEMMKQLLGTPLKTEGEYVYSDLAYYFMQRIIEKQSGRTLDEYVDSVFYAPLGMSTMAYLPRKKFPLGRLIPTEYDVYFRDQLIHGDVHDPGAAMMGGVAGHAGLFSNANDLGKYMQMLMDGGYYGGQQFLNDSIVREFTRCQFCEQGTPDENRRGAGFDKPLLDGSPGPTCGCTDLETFGHQGFTGTVTWADPAEETVYVFLSNRVYPNAGNNKLASMNIRTRVQDAFYDAIEKNRPLALED